VDTARRREYGIRGSTGKRYHEEAGISLRQSGIEYMAVSSG